MATKMIKPTISLEEEYRKYGNHVYRLHIPYIWLVQTRHPRLELWWWLTKLIWHVRKEAR